ncbi:MAG TPA: aminotransferase class V-fold PLP-dependent enzyme [Ginsengibacter sp.]|nr:aminotransferase class V-fold PLP-dependent enzyme [Ginsengibacter sp.]
MKFPFGLLKKIVTSDSKTQGDVFFNRLRKKEYSRLDKTGHIYLDYTGGNIHPQSLVDKHYKYLKNVFGNPHSSNPASHLSEKFVSEARNKVLNFFNAKDYYCVFTANASAALKIVGECYPFSPESHLLLTADNHNSVNGIRDYCRYKGGSHTYCPMRNDDLTIDADILNKFLDSHNDKQNKLFAYPAQSNVSGVQHSLAWIKKAQENGWDVLLDAAAFVPTSALNLSEVHPDFVPVSFYKIFGYPTGIGCLLVKKSKFHKLKKPWYAGGTITISSARYNGYFLKPDHEKFEDGTVNYLDIPAITSGLNYITAIGMKNISSRIKELCEFFLLRLLQLKHDNGLPMIKLYGPSNTTNRGGTFLINFLDANGKLFPFQFIEDRANAEMISLRTGCFCNPGIDETNHGISASELQSFFTSREHGDYFDMIQYMGKLRGAVRISIGLPTTKKDISGFISFAKTILNINVPAEILPIKDFNTSPSFKLKKNDKEKFVFSINSSTL